MIFQLDTTIMTLDHPAQYPLTSNTKLIQTKDRSASGITHVEDFEVTTNEYKYNFVNMGDIDYSKLLDWFLNITNGMMLEFLLTDDLGTQRLVRFLEPTLNFTKDSFQLWSGSFSVEYLS